jgi:hypothetical protein
LTENPPGSGELEFEEFCILSAKFLIEEDEESLKEELKEAFRIYDKEGEIRGIPAYTPKLLLSSLITVIFTRITIEFFDQLYFLIITVPYSVTARFPI